MIVDAILALLRTILQPLLDALPSLDFSALVTACLSGAASIGTTLGHADAVFPVSELFGILILVWNLVPVFFAYTAFKWVWRHIPTIAGFGTGDG